MLALQKKWYAKLKKSGFDDIEDLNSPREFLKTWHSNYFQLRYHPTAFSAKADYYRQASHFLHCHSFPNPKDETIWRLHAEGLSLNQIALELKRKYRRSKRGMIHKIITKYALLMKFFEFEDDDDF